MIILAFLLLYCVACTGLIAFLFKRNQYLQQQLKQLPQNLYSIIPSEAIFSKDKKAINKDLSSARYVV